MQSRARATRNAITAAAGNVFGSHRFESAALTEISARAGTTTGAIYFHFDSKEDLARHILREFVREVELYCTGLLERESSPLESLAFSSLAWARRIMSDPVVAGGVRLSLDRPDLLNRADDAWVPWVTTAATLLERARERGEVPRTVNVESATSSLIDNFVGVQLRSRMRTGHKDLEERVADLWKHTLIGLLPQGDHADADRRIERVLGELAARSRTPIIGHAEPSTSSSGIPERSGDSCA
jgi:AcrR family transcriptional regulator